MAHLDFDIEQHYTAGERQFILYEYFQKYTGKGRAVSRKQIFEYLKTFDISISPHTLYNDLEILRGTMKLDIQFDSHASPDGSGGYWLKNPKFEPIELRWMVDGIQSLKFITQEKAQQITRKIKDLADIQTQTALNRPAFVSNRVRSLNDKAVEEADRLYEAIAADRKIKFQYAHYYPDRSKGKKYSKHGEPLTVSPYALYWNNGNYYLYAYNGKKFTYYRVDRMEKISRPLLEEREAKEEFREKDLTSNKVKVFDMYGGDEYLVKIRFRNQLADQVIDQFGRDIMMIPCDKEHFTITAPIQVSPTFFAWIATFGRRVKILSPEPVVEKMREFIQRVSDMYQDD